MLKKIFIALFAVFIIASGTKTNGQQLLDPTFSFSGKKTSYITLSDGTELKGIMKGVTRKNGLIKLVKFEDGNGEILKLKPSTIKFMYLAPNGMETLSKKLDFVTDATKWNNETLDNGLLKGGYVYYENAKVKIKNKEMVFLMQLLNPTFCKKIKVYHDPMAAETVSAGVGGVKLVGGIAKSYFVSINGDVAYKLEKKRYKKEFLPLWKSCDSLVKKYPDIKWKELTKHIIDFTECQ